MLTLREVERKRRILDIHLLATKVRMVDMDNNPDNIFNKILNIINGEKE